MDSIPTYLEYKHNPEKITYIHEKLKPIMEVTYGCLIYQEQVMEVVRELGGYSYGRSDLVRRAMGKKKMDVMEEERQYFIHGKTDENCIFFKIRKLEIICFNTGICFLLIKTSLDSTNEFTDLLNFNYRFRDIQKEDEGIGTYQNIHLQTDTFSDVKKFTDLIENITGSKVESIKLDLETERFLSYSYVCIDQQNWGMNNPFENVENNFVKFSNFLSADNSVDFGRDNNAVSFSKWKYAKLSASKQGVTLFASDADMYNYTILPDEFEGIYLYTYILNLYKKIYLKKIDFEFQKTQDTKSACKKFVDFTKKLWIQEVTDEEVGSWINLSISKKLEIDKLYFEVKNQFDVLYKNMKIERNSKITLVLVGVLVVTLVFNILNYFKLF